MSTVATAQEVELLAYLEKKVQEAIAWEQAGEGRWSSIAHAEYTLEYIRYWGWGSVEQYRLDSIRNDYCDLHKSVRGVKARWAFDMTYEECEVAIKDLRAECSTPEWQEARRQENEYYAKLEREYQEELEWESKIHSEMAKGAPDLSSEPDEHELYQPIFRF